MDLTLITPLILTFNEEPNIGRVLAKLAWAKKVVVLDSGSTDKTIEIIQSFANTEIHTRKFDSHAVQWNYGLKECGIESEWMLGMDADYVLTDELIEEISNLQITDDINGYFISFRYAVLGKVLRGALYPPLALLYRRATGEYFQDGHAHRLVPNGKYSSLSGKIIHDDRKALSRWLPTQLRYARLEADLLKATPVTELTVQDRIRRWKIIAPWLVPMYYLIWQGGWKDGWPGLYYALQRVIAESLLSLALIEQQLQWRESQ